MILDPIARALAGAFAPLDTRPIYQWAGDGNIMLPPAYAREGEFTTRGSRYLEAPFDALRDHRVRRVTVVASVQTGKTLLADIAVPWFTANRPGPILWTFHVRDVATQHAISRAVPVIKSCKALAGLLPRDPRKMGALGVEFPHMVLQIRWATEANLQSRSIMVLINDELWQWTPQLYKWARARTTAYVRSGLSKELNLSQAGARGDVLDGVFSSGSREEWCVPCQGCGALFWPEWRGKRADGSEWGMLWDMPPGGRDDRAAIESLRYVSPCCGHVHLDSARLKALWDAGGAYVARNPRAPEWDRSFRWNSLPVDPWDGLVVEWLDAMDALHQGITQPLVIFRQQRLTEQDDPERGGENEQTFTLEYDAADKWADEVARAAMVDVQADHYWVEIRSFDAAANSRQLWWGRVDTEDEIAGKVGEFGVPENCVFVDFSWQKSADSDRREVADMICRRNWCGLRGEDREMYLHVSRSGRRTLRIYSAAKFMDPHRGHAGAGRLRAKYFAFASPSAADIVGRLRVGKLAKWANPPGNHEHTRQLFAETKRKKIDEKTGRERWAWVQTRRDNHSFDLWKMFAVFCHMHPQIAFGGVQKVTEPNAQADAAGVSDTREETDGQST